MLVFFENMFGMKPHELNGVLFSLLTNVVLAIGNPFGVGQTVTSGIVSAMGRNQLGINTFENFIQTDAAINPGNSGGALVDTRGHLIGINTAIYSRSGGSMGIGFAIPVNTARDVMESIIKNGSVVRGWIGVEPMNISAEMASTLKISADGVLINGTLKGGGVVATVIIVTTLRFSMAVRRSELKMWSTPKCPRKSNSHSSRCSEGSMPAFSASVIARVVASISALVSA